MKTKILISFLSLFYISSYKPIQQTDENQLYKVIIFKWIKNEKGEEQKKTIFIDQNGKITLNKKEYTTNINIKKFTKSVNLFIKTEKLIKEDASNEPPRMDDTPKNGEQFINITIVKLKDFNNEKDFANNSRYSYRIVKKISDVNIDLYKYLHSDDLKILKKIIN